MLNKRILMKKLIYLIVAIVALGLVLTGCSLLSNVGQVPNTEEKYNENNPNPNLPFGPGELVAGQNTVIGTVTVSNDDTSLYVIYDTTGSDWVITETHLEVAAELTDIPQTKKGNPIPGKFEYSTEHDPAVTEHTYTIPLEDGNKVLCIAAHAKVEKRIDGEIIQEETAWAGDLPFDGKNWATYSKYTVTQAPVLQFCTAGDGISELTTEQAYSGIYSVKFHTDSWGETSLDAYNTTTILKYAAGIPVDIPLNEITELSYWRNGVGFLPKIYDYAPPAVLLCIDANNDGKLDFDTCDALSYGPLGDDAILVIEADWIATDNGWSKVDVLAKDWRWGTAWWIDKNGWSGWLIYSSLEEVIAAGGFDLSDAGYPCPIDPTDHIMLVVIAGGNPDGDVYIDDITINSETYDLEPD